MKHNSVDQLVEKLHQAGSLAVWSVIITTFGDAIAPRGGVIALSSLQPVLDAIHIEPNAVRTALSRLARDGWVKRNRTGRQSFYSLSAERLAVFRAATQRIYATGPQDWNGEFEIVLANAKDQKSRALTRLKMREAGFGEYSTGVYARPIHTAPDQPLPENAGVVFKASEISGVSVQDFVGQCWPVEDTMQLYENIIVLFTPVFEELTGNPDWPPVQFLAMRILLIHEWRKVVLRDVDLPAQCKPNGKVEEQARTLVARLYRALVPQSEQFLDNCLAGPQTVLPKPGAEFHQRFDI